MHIYECVCMRVYTCVEKKNRCVKRSRHIYILLYRERDIYEYRYLQAPTHAHTHIYRYE